MLWGERRGRRPIVAGNNRWSAHTAALAALEQDAR